VANLKSAEISYATPERVKGQLCLARVELWLIATTESLNAEFPASHGRLGQGLCDIHRVLLVWRITNGGGPFSALYTTAKYEWGGVSLLREDALSILTSSEKIWCQHMRGDEVLLLLFLSSFLSSPRTADYTVQEPWQNNGVRDHRHHHRRH